MEKKCVVEVQAGSGRGLAGEAVPPFRSSHTELDWGRREAHGRIALSGRRPDPGRVRKERHRERRAFRRRGSVRPGPGRNGAVILDVLRDALLRHGRILEVASGSGEHAVRTAGGHAPIRASGLAGSGCRE
ncbi:DUF938 domain-containing protein [Methylorubrum extorquens]|uniref:DUF938 domain-containing protein n=1 Tax=Methylorubrum extorquens TaxID=408 RepID=UPI002AA2B39D|nr:DUF938 domain-containing protein [Methylorubrum extorquens]